jgi:hypothetical protein
MDDVIRRIYREFDPAPLKPGQTNLYVDLHAVRGDEYVTDRLEQRIRLSEHAICQVLPGHRGSGKSTELRFLKYKLEHPGKEPRQFVVLCEADDYVDRNDVDFPEILIAVVRQMAAELRQREGISLNASYLRDRVRRLGKLLTTEVNFDELELDVGLLKVSAALKGSPDAREDVRKLLEPDTSNWIEATNRLIGDATVELRKKGYAGMTVLVDDLDKMILRPHEKAGCSTTEYLFVHRAAQLTAFECHVLYSMPLSLAYSHQEQTIKSLYGGHVPVIPMVKVLTRPPTSSPFQPGVDKLVEMIERRLQNANAGQVNVFSSDAVRDDLIMLTGGQPTALMTLIREAIVTNGLPITAEALARVRKEGRREFAHFLRHEHWALLREVNERGVITRTSANENAFRELLDGRAILQYVNDEEWYGVNPLAIDLIPPKGAAS